MKGCDAITRHCTRLWPHIDALYHYNNMQSAVTEDCDIKSNGSQLPVEKLKGMEELSNGSAHGGLFSNGDLGAPDSVISDLFSKSITAALCIQTRTPFSTQQKPTCMISRHPRSRPQDHLALAWCSGIKTLPRSNTRSTTYRSPPAKCPHRMDTPSNQVK